jgi:F-type H+-transporting ATPase subunit gamma
MIEPDRAQTRLENVRSVQPILSALHSISLGSWQAALNQSERARQYRKRLSALLPLVGARLPAKPHRSRERKSAPAAKSKTAVLVVGSERGLCGRFNTAVVERAEMYLSELEAGDVSFELMGLGSRVCRAMERQGRELVWSGNLSTTTLPSYSLACELTQYWLARYEAREIDGVDLIYNAYGGMGNYASAVARLIPPIPPQAEQQPGQEALIIETDPLALYTRVIEQSTATHLYELILDSAAAEHAARYELMEVATRNTEDLIADLTLAIQTSRQRAITQEMQELAAGAGMIGTRNH